MIYCYLVSYLLFVQLDEISNYSLKWIYKCENSNVSNQKISWKLSLKSRSRRRINSWWWMENSNIRFLWFTMRHKLKWQIIITIALLWYKHIFSDAWNEVRDESPLGDRQASKINTSTQRRIIIILSLGIQFNIRFSHVHNFMSHT